jgi:CHAP domain
MSIEGTLARVEAIRQTLADPALLVGSSKGLTGGVEAPSSTGGSAGTESSFADALAQASGDYEGAAADASSAPTAYAAGTSADGGAAGSITASPDLPYGVGVASPYVASASLLPNADGVAGASTSTLSGIDAADQDSPGARIVAIAESQLGQTEQPPGSNESTAIAQYRSATAGAIPGAPWCAYFASWVANQAGEPIGEGGQGAGAVSDVWSWAQSTGRAIVNGPGVVPKPGDLIVFGDEHVGIVKGVLPNGQIQTIEGNYENKVAANVRTPTEATGYVEMS